MIFKQTWWDTNLNNRMQEFESWIGDSNSQSKVYLRNHIKEKGYLSVLDLGCGTATEFFALQKELPNVKYIGVDSSNILYDRNTKLGVNMVCAPAEDTKLPDKHVDCVFSRHVLEHQPDFKPILEEMIRLAAKEAIHIFFIPPSDTPTHIGYDSNENLYHNRYNKKEIEDFLTSKELSYNWVDINKNETSLQIITNI